MPIPRVWIPDKEARKKEAYSPARTPDRDKPIPASPEDLDTCSNRVAAKAAPGKSRCFWAVMRL